jgi:two-component system LytT family response regulator
MPPTIFVTAFDDYAIRAFDVHALDYLLKPFGRQRLEKALVRARRHLQRDRAQAVTAQFEALVKDLRNPAPVRNRIVVRTGGRVSFLDVDQIDWVEAEGNYVRLHVGGESHLVRDTMNGVLARLNSDRFFRIHRSRIVRLDRIQSLHLASGGDYDVVLQNGVRLGLSRLYKDDLQARLATGG